MDELPGWVIVVLCIGILVVGCSVKMAKVDNCKEAGWEYHYGTGQCLPKGK